LLLTALTAVPISFSWVREGLYTLSSSQRIAKPSSTPASGAAALPMESMWRRARAMMPDAQESGASVFPARRPDAVEVVTVSADAPHANARSYLYSTLSRAACSSSCPTRRSRKGCGSTSGSSPAYRGGWRRLRSAAPVPRDGRVPVLAYTGYSSYLRRRFKRATEPRR
jgi:hypothetical protein